MVINRSEMKRKRKEDCSSPLLDESPKRTKVHAQRKFAQGSNVNSPVITPVKELEKQEIDVLPEPVELLPIKRPNTEDFLTFLCFRGTPILPPSLNFFNTASIVDTNGQVHEIKSESPKNGPIDTSSITKTGSGSSERPFVAFGVRKRADPIVISRQMDKKRRHALALQALRRKYQEQRMAKIRAVTISKLSEKVTSKTLVRSNSVTKTETVSKKSNTLQKSKVNVVATKHVKVTTQTVKALRPQIKQKMCLRSFRGRFVQKELQFRNVKKRPLPVKKITKNCSVKKVEGKEKSEVSSEYSSDDEKPLSKASKDVKSPKVILPKIAKKNASGPKKPVEINFRITRSNKILNNKIVLRRQQIKQRMLLTTPKTIVKPRTLRSHTAQKSKILQETKQKILQTKTQKQSEKKKEAIKKEPLSATKKHIKTTDCPKKEVKENVKKDVPKPVENVKKQAKVVENLKKEVKPVENVKKEAKPLENMKKEVKPTDNMKKEAKSVDNARKETKSVDNVRKETKSTENVKKETKPIENLKKESKPIENLKKEVKPADNSKKVISKLLDSVKKEISCNTGTGKGKIDKSLASVKKEMTENPKKAKLVSKSVSQTVTKKVESTSDSQVKKENITVAKKENLNKKKPAVILKKTGPKVAENPAKKEPVHKKDLNKIIEESDKKEDVVKSTVDQKENVESKTSQRPSRKTKEAAAIYMEILSHKLVNESKIDDDNVSIDSFPELPNVKKTEQRENELKAKAKSTKTSENELSNDTRKPAKSKEVEIVENKNLRSGDKKKLISQKKNEHSDVKNTESEKTDDIKKGGGNVDLCKKKNNPEEDSINEKEKPKQNLEETKKITTKIENVKEEAVQICDRKTRSAVHEKLVEKIVGSPLEKIKEVELKVHINPIDVEVESKKLTIKCESKEPIGKRKNPEKFDAEVSSDSDVLIKQVKVKKSEEKTAKSGETDSAKRQTRNSSQNFRHVESDDSDESFRADIKIPRKKQITRSKISKSHESDQEESDNKANIKKSLRTKPRSYKECSSSESDHSTTSDVNVKQIKAVNKNKKFTKTRNQQKSEQSFSDSDEEPLSKLTQNKAVETKAKEITACEKQIKPDAETKPTKTNKDNKDKIEEEHSEKDTNFKKPKRECAKRPQNYLPMFSSSDEDDNYFHGFKMKTEIIKPSKTSKIPENSCTHVPTSLDLSCKDIGRRFGKGKVNMSNEQIEKWLKDSAMAGNSVKNENDEMLKFGEKIPTETSHNIATSIDTEKLKTLLIISAEKQDVESEKKIDISPKSVPSEAVILNKLTVSSKPIMIDRKLIFRNKAKVIAAPNVNAFSASNESSVYAFGEETEHVMKTPFRRPTRRPSSTATSRSEDESSKYEEVLKAGQFRKPPTLKQDPSKSTKESVLADDTPEETIPLDTDDNTFYIPLQPQKSLVVNNKSKSVLLSSSQKFEKPVASTSMVPPSTVAQKSSSFKHHLKHSPRTFDRNSETSEELKYKIPSSPSASSSSSAKLYKRPNSKPKFRASEILPVKLPEFPVDSICGQLIEAPTFHPSEKEFQDPIEYIEKIRFKAEQFGICRIVPPSTFKPECKVTDDMRFTAYNQYVHKMLHRWGPNFKELMAIKKYLSTQNISLTHPPWIGGMEIDLPRLYQTVQSLGGLKEVIEKKKWPKVSDAMKIPKSAQDRVTKLDDIYCKYLLPYDTLSPAEREKLFDEVETEWAKRESKSLLKAQQNVDDNTNEVESESDDEAEECIVKGRSMALNAFYRIARNTMSMWFKNSEPLAQEVEQEFWKHVTVKQNHICVHSGSIDSGNWGYGFAVSKNSPFARHAWNLKVLTNNSGSVLRSLGPIMGVTVPTLHVGMVFSSCCWCRDPHSLPWIEYLHTGGNKIWYGIPDSTSASFHRALKTLVPNYCRNKSLWLPSDTVMVPPNLLVENGVSLCRIVQEPGQFIIVFPKVFTSSLSTGYVVSESVYFAPPYWLKTARIVFNELRNSCEPSMFSLDRLLLSIINDPRSNVEVLKQIIPAVQELCDKEKLAREKIKSLGVSAIEKLPVPEATNVRKKKKLQDDDGEYECEICSLSLFMAMVTESQEDGAYCLDHAAELIEKKKIQSKHCKLTYTYDDHDLEGLVDKIKTAIVSKMQKKIPNKYAGMPTLLTK